MVQALTCLFELRWDEVLDLVILWNHLSFIIADEEVPLVECDFEDVIGL